MPADNRAKVHFVCFRGVPFHIRLPIKHLLSQELQLYFDEITRLTLKRSESPSLKAALLSLETDLGIHPLVPHFTFFVANEVYGNLNNLSRLFALMRLVWSLLRNPHIHIKQYLDEVMVSVMTCLVSKRLGNTFSDNHWDLRNYTASLVAWICKRFGCVDHNLKSRVTKTLLDASLDKTNSLSRHYGVVQGLAALGPDVVQSVILCNLGPYLQLLEPLLHLEKQKNETKRHEAWMLCEALMRAVGLCIYDPMKMLPPQLSAPAPAVCKSNSKVVTTSSNKRKASANNMMQQLPLKKLATESPNSLLRKRYVGGSSSSSRKIVGSEEGLKWIEDMDELFGESLLTFVPSPHASIFL